MDRAEPERLARDRGASPRHAQGVPERHDADSPDLDRTARLRALYRKLGAGTRAEAMAKAIDLRLLPPED